MKTFHFYGTKPIGRKNKLKRIAITGILEKNTLKIGTAVCSLKDQFNRKTGRLISTGRAIKKPEIILKASDTNIAKQFVEWANKYCKTKN